MSEAIQDMRVAQLHAERACDHGAMTRRAGRARTGRTWAGWFCPEDVCDPEWYDTRAIVTDALDAWTREETPA